MVRASELEPGGSLVRFSTGTELGKLFWAFWCWNSPSSLITLYSKQGHGLSWPNDIRRLADIHSFIVKSYRGDHQYAVATAVKRLLCVSFPDYSWRWMTRFDHASQNHCLSCYSCEVGCRHDFYLWWNLRWESKWEQGFIDGFKISLMLW